MRMVLVLLAALLSGHSGAEQILRTKSGDVAIHMSPPQGWCRWDPNAVILSSDEELFDTGNARLRKVLSALGTAVTSKCKKARKLTVLGRIDGADVYLGVVSKHDGWTSSSYHMPLPGDHIDVRGYGGQAIDARREVFPETHAKWCGKAAYVDVVFRGDENSSIQPNSGYFSVFEKTYEPAIRSKCPQAETAVITHYIANRNDPINRFIVPFDGHAHDVAILGIDNQPVARTLHQARSIAKQTVNRCDELAAHPADPGKPGGVYGVYDDQLEAETAIDACIDVAEGNQGVPRYDFQLGRALLAGGLHDEAADYFEGIAENGYGPAQYYLARLYEQGLGVPQNSGEAQRLYALASKSGFDPDSTTSTTSSASTEIFDVGGLHEPKMLGAIYEGDYKHYKLTHDRYYAKAYLFHVADSLSQMQNMQGTPCTNLFSKQEVERLRAASIGEDAMAAAPYENPMSALQAMVGIAKRGGSMGVMQQELAQTEKRSNAWSPAMTDAGKIFERNSYDCGAKQLQLFAKNLSQFVLR